MLVGSLTALAVFSRQRHAGQAERGPAQAECDDETRTQLRMRTQRFGLHPRHARVLRRRQIDGMASKRKRPRRSSSPQAARDCEEEFGLVGVEYRRGYPNKEAKKVKTTIITLLTAVQIIVAPAVLARNVSTKTPDKHHKAFNRGHQVVTGKVRPRPSTSHMMAEPEKPSPGY